MRWSGSRARSAASPRPAPDPVRSILENWRFVMAIRHFLDLDKIDAKTLRAILDAAHAMKRAGRRPPAKLKPKGIEDALLAMIFEKPSTRTRVSFDVAMRQLGGETIMLTGEEMQRRRGETISDTAKVLSRYVDGIMARTFAHKTVTDLAEHASVPVINGLTDLSHPCQSMTDYFTAWEKFGDLKGRKLAYVGDGNNMAHSLMLAGPKLGMDVAIATPAAYAPAAEMVSTAKADAKAAGTKMVITTSVDEAVAALARAAIPARSALDPVAPGAATARAFVSASRIASASRSRPSARPFSLIAVSSTSGLTMRKDTPAAARSLARMALPEARTMASALMPRRLCRGLLRCRRRSAARRAW